MSERTDSAPSAGDRLRAALVSFLGLGYAPVASGTFGTLGGVAVVLALLPLRDQEWFHFGAAMIVIVLACLGIGVWCGRWAERYYGKKDPGHFVIDEVAGYCVTLFVLSGDWFPSLREIVVAFFVFRLFDVVKPPPSRQFEALPHGWGIVMDDIVAGVYSAMLIWVLRDHYDWTPWVGWTL